MKKIFIVSALSLFSLMLKAQTHTEFGLKAGANFANLKFEDGNTNSLVSLHAGALAHIHVTPHFAVQPEVMFSGQGAKADDDNKLKLGYINVPVLAQYMTNGFRLQTGPQFGFLVDAKQKSGDESIEVDDNYKNFDFSWSFGAGYLTKVGVGIDARYNLGLTNIVEDGDIKNSVFQVGLFFQLLK